MRRWPISVAILLAVVATGLLAPGAAAEDVYSERTLDIARELQCPICSGESVAASQTTIAKQMRDTIERQVQAGESNEQIIDYFVARYPNILMEPPKSGFTLTLWWVPPIVLLIGALVVVLYFREGASRKPRRPSDNPPGHEDEELEALAREYLNPDTKPRPS